MSTEAARADGRLEVLNVLGRLVRAWIETRNVELRRYIDRDMVGSALQGIGGLRGPAQGAPDTPHRM